MDRMKAFFRQILSFLGFLWMSILNVLLKIYGRGVIFGLISSKNSSYRHFNLKTQFLELLNQLKNLFFQLYSSFFLLIMVFRLFIQLFK